MNSFDNMDIEDLLNNPLKNVDVTSGARPRAPEKVGDDAAGRQKPIPATRRAMTDVDSQRMEKNQPSADRLLSLEKSVFSADHRVDTLKRIIEEQNLRIQKIEEELDILRGHLKGVPGVFEIDDHDSSISPEAAG